MRNETLFPEESPVTIFAGDFIPRTFIAFGKRLVTSYAFGWAFVFIAIRIGFLT